VEVTSTIIEDDTSVKQEEPQVVDSQLQVVYQEEPMEIGKFQRGRVREEPLKKDETGENIEIVVASNQDSKKKSSDFKAPKVIKERYLVRYAIFIDSSNAANFSKKLEEKGVKSSVLESNYPLPSFSIKAGPFVNPDSRKSAQKELKKLGVAPIPFIEQKYTVSGSVWNRSVATAVLEKLERLGIQAELIVEKKPKRVYKVVSDIFDEIETAKLYVAKAEGAGIKTMIEKFENER